MLQHRLVAIALWASILLPFGSPYVGAASTSDLPACCRNNGKHHCAMSARMGNLEEPGEGRFRSAPENCPFRPMRLGTMAPQLAQPLQPLQFHAGLEQYPSGTGHIEGLAPACPSRSHLKRGPPALA